MFNILTWNTQRAKIALFTQTLKEHILNHKPSIVALFEPRISDFKADRVCECISFKKNYSN